jgi:peroxiredoxin
VTRWSEPWPPALVGTFAVICALGCAAQPARGGEGAAPANAAAARPPDFELPTLGGGSERLSDHLGRDVVLLDFWATYCEPCLRSMPGLNGLYEKYSARGFVVFGISIDAADALPEVRAEVRKLGIKFPILLDQETRVVGLYNPKTSAPFSVLIARNGAILQRKEGYTTGSHADLERDIEAALDAR